MLTLLFILFSFAPSPTAPAIDCSKPPDVPACCDAETRSCDACAERGQAIVDAWNEACLDRLPAPVRPAPKPAPKPIAGECKQRPARKCCQAESEACLSCKREGLRELEEWLTKCHPVERPRYRLL